MLRKVRERFHLMRQPGEPSFAVIGEPANQVAPILRRPIGQGRRRSGGSTLMMPIEQKNIFVLPRGAYYRRRKSLRLLPGVQRRAAVCRR